MTTNHSRRCSKCANSFKPVKYKPYAKQCPTCRRTRAGVAGPAMDETHTHEWDKRSLGLVEANVLRRAWGSNRSTNVTEN